MPGRESKWSWLSPDRVLHAVGSGRKRAESGAISAEEEENPWMTLQSRQPAKVKAETPDWTEVKSTASMAPATPTRWLGDDSSPYGFTDDDGTLKQVDSAAWRKPGPPGRTQKFIPSKKSSTPRWQAGTSSGGGAIRSPKRTGSTWMLQSICAIGLVAGALYGHQSHNPVAQKVQGVFADMFQQDYGQSALPTVQNFFNAHHISLPAIGSIGAVHLHPPLDGAIATDYSTTHPEMVITGQSNAMVSAVGSGTVRKVVKLSSGNMVTIDHGSLGTSEYVGLAEVSVKESEYVNAGQVIGKLPAEKSPQLHFAMEKNGHYIDPHDEIHFASSGV